MTTRTLLDTRSTRVTLLGIIGFVVAVAAASQVAIPLPGTPVPFTLQPMLVVLAGMMLGPVAGALSMMLYLWLGAAGLPVFAPMGAPGLARLLGPTGGYLIAYPFAAFVAGLLAQRAKNFATRSLAAMAGMLVVYVGGLAQLAILTGSFTTAAVLGALPFAATDVVKSFVAGAVTGRRAAREA